MQPNAVTGLGLALAGLFVLQIYYWVDKIRSASGKSVT